MEGFPLDPAGFLNVAVAAAVAGLLAQWLKQYLTNWRFTNLLVLGLGVAIQLGATWASGAHNWWGAAWAGFLGASIATYGYETIVNLVGVAGFGTRKTP